MNIGPIGAIAQNSGSTPITAPGRAAEPEGAGFGAMLSDLGSSTVSALQRAEQASLSALQGKGDTREVVETIMQAERSLTTAMAVRDKLVAAFQEITRMSI